jgi:hypothetical protein
MTTQAIYEKRGTAVTFVNTGGDKTLNMKALAAVTGRLSAFADRGAGAAPGEYEVRAYCPWVANPTVGESLQVWIVESDGTHTDGGATYDATNDAAFLLVVANACPNYALAVIAHTADTAEKGAKGMVRITSRYYAVGVYNASAAKTLADTNSVSAVVVTPIYPDVQAAA